MTLSTLAKASGISVRSITAYENGRKNPSEESLQALARALEVRVGFLEASPVEEIPVDLVSFRALSKMSALERESALSVGRIAMLINSWNESRFRLPTANVPTLPGVSPEDSANRVRAMWGLGEAPIPNMIHLLEANGVRVFSLASDCASVDAFSLRYDSKPYVFLNNLKSGERSRFDAAHELGHLVMHAEHRIPHGPDAEEEAQAFASAFLMPRADVIAQSLYDATADRILVAKARWKVAAMALTYRLHDLRLLSDWKYRNVAQQLSQLGYRRSEPGGITRETSQLLMKVVRSLKDQDNNGWKLLADHLELDIDEVNRHIFGLIPVAVQGGGQKVHTDPPALRLVTTPAQKITSARSSGFSIARSDVSVRRHGEQGLR